MNDHRKVMFYDKYDIRMVTALIITNIKAGTLAAAAKLSRQIVSFHSYFTIQDIVGFIVILSILILLTLL